MDRVTNVQAITSRVIEDYATRSLNSKLYYIHDDTRKIDSVLVVPLKRDIEPHIMVMTRIEGDQVIIEADTTDRPLDEALVAAGIPRAQIVLAYSGEIASLA